MKTKLEMAHEWAMQAIDTGYVCETGTLVIEAWAYADTMQAEADKRNHNSDTNEMTDDWQPDWSQAPKEYPTVTGWYIFKSQAHWICDDVPCGPAPTFGITGNHIVERRTI